VFFERVIYLYRDSVTVLAKIATPITLMDKIKMEFIRLSINHFQQHLWIGSKETHPQKWRKQTIGFE